MKDLNGGDSLRDFFGGRSGTMRSRALRQLLDEGRDDLVWPIIEMLMQNSKSRVNTPKIRKYHAWIAPQIAGLSDKLRVFRALQKVRLV